MQGFSRCGKVLKSVHHHVLPQSTNHSKRLFSSDSMTIQQQGTKLQRIKPKWIIGTGVACYAIGSYMNSSETSDGILSLNSNNTRNEMMFEFNLSKSIFEGNLEKARSIVNMNGSDVSDIKYLIVASVRDPRSVSKVLDYFNIELTEGEWVDTLKCCMSNSVYQNRRLIVPWILQNKITRLDEELVSDLVTASIRNYDPLALEALIKHGAVPNQHHLEMALSHDHLMLNIIQTVLKHGNCKPTGEHLMKIAANAKNLESKGAKKAHAALVQLLIDHGADVNYMNRDYTTIDEACANPSARRLITFAQNLK